jgi:hypothetical protein
MKKLFIPLLCFFHLLVYADVDTKDGAAITTATNQDGFTSNISKVDGQTIASGADVARDQVPMLQEKAVQLNGVLMQTPAITLSRYHPMPRFYVIWFRDTAEQLIIFQVEQHQVSVMQPIAWEQTKI